MSRRCSSPGLPQPASLLDSDDLLREILVRLPPRPSFFSCASSVCTRWRHLVSDPDFRRHLRARHRKPPLLGVFSLRDGKHRFTPTLDPPDRIPGSRFSLPHEARSTFHGCRHGLAVFLDRPRDEAIVWNPVTGHQRRVAFPLGPDNRPVKKVRNASVLSASGGDGHFRLAVVWIDDDTTRAFACLYDSESGVWGNVVTTETRDLVRFMRSAVLVRNALCWHLYEDNILDYDLERQSLVLIKKPPLNNAYTCCHIVRTENDGLGLAILTKELNIQIWEMNSNCPGVHTWIMWKTIQLNEQPSPLIPRAGRRRIRSASILGYEEDSNMMFLSTDAGYFTVQLETSQFRNLPGIDRDPRTACYPYSNFYSPGR